jgi:acyl dehydratase
MKQKSVYQESIAQFRESLGRLWYPPLDTSEGMARQNEVATKDAIRHFANGIGDSNPLWRNPEYARRTRYGGIIAPPTFLTAIYPVYVQLYEDVFSFPTQASWQWSDIIHEGDVITPVYVNQTLIDKSKEGEELWGGKERYLAVARTTYRNQRDEIIGSVDCTALLLSISGMKTSRLVVPETYKYNREELEAIERSYDKEEVQGANPRYWEDVTIGEEMKPVVKGPLSHGDMVAFMVGIGWEDNAHGLCLNMMRKQPVWGYTDPDTGVWERMCGIHFVDRIAQNYNHIPRALDFEIQRVAWFGHLMTNWMGDDGFLKKLDVTVRDMHFLGDTLWCKGKVARKYVEGGEHLVDCELWGENQKGQRISPGCATVALPTRVS